MHAGVVKGKRVMVIPWIKNKIRLKRNGVKFCLTSEMRRENSLAGLESRFLWDVGETKGEVGKRSCQKNNSWEGCREIWWNGILASWIVKRSEKK